MFAARKWVVVLNRERCRVQSRMLIGRVVVLTAAAAVAVLAPVALARAGAPPGSPTISVDDPTLDLSGGVTQVVFTLTRVEQTVPPPTVPPGSLPATGSSTVPVVVIGAVFIAAGLAMFVVRRRPGSLPVAVVCATVAAASLAGVSSAQAAPTDAPVTVSFHTEDGTAIAPDDYTATSGTISFAEGQTTAVVVVTVSAQAGAGSFRLVLTDPVGATLAKSAGQATLIGSGSPTTSTSTTVVPPTTATTTLALPTTTLPTTTTTMPTTTTTSTTSSTTSTTVAPVPGCVAMDGYSYRVPDGASLSHVTVTDRYGDDFDVAYAYVEGWYDATCTGRRPLATFFFPSESEGYLYEAMDALYPGNCGCGVAFDVTIEGLGTGLVYLLAR